MPKVDIENSEQNRFVQDYLTEMMRTTRSPDDDEGIELVIELVQESFDYQKRAEALGVPDWALLKDNLVPALEQMMALGAGTDLVEAFNLTYAFCNAVLGHLDIDSRSR